MALTSPCDDRVSGESEVDVNELSFLEEVARGPFARHRQAPDFVVAQWFRDALHARGCLRLGSSRRIDASPDGETSFSVLGLTPAGETYLAALRADEVALKRNLR